MSKQAKARIAVITGASSGMGREFVRQISRRDNIDEIWVIARRKDRLEALVKDSEKFIRPIPLDLTEKSAFDVLHHHLEEHTPDVKVVVNAAGLGKIALTRELSLAEHDQMIDLNCRAAVDTTMTVLPYMKRGGEIINICSVAGFQPLPGLNTYAATKAFLLSWTKALHHELLSSGIHVTALCPYWVKDTEFIPVAKETGKTSVKSFPFAGHAKGIVSAALRASRLNLWVVSPGPVAKAERFLSWVIPDFLVVPIWDVLRRL